MTTTTYQAVKRYKRGASWDDGSTRTCTVCRIEIAREERRRANQAVVVALSKGTGRFKLPVGYCEQHIPEELQEKEDTNDS